MIPSGVLVCSRRERVVADLTRQFALLGVDARVAGSQDDWPQTAASLVVLDLSDPDQPIEAAAKAFAACELIALVDNQSLAGLIPALTAGCHDYLFYPINPPELSLKWRRHVDGPPDTAAVRTGGDEDHVGLEFPSDIRYVRDVVNEIVTACEERAFRGPRATLNLRVALTEAINNAVLYGNRQDRFKRVTVTAVLGPRALTVTVVDEGGGFDPSSVADPTLPANLQKSRGRGLFLIRSLSDDVAFNALGNAITLRFVSENLSSRPGNADSPGRSRRIAGPGYESESPRLQAFLREYERVTNSQVRLRHASGDEAQTLYDGIGENPGTGMSPSLAAGPWKLPGGDLLRADILGADPETAELTTRLLEEAAVRLVGSEREARFLGRELADRNREIGLLTSASETLASFLDLETAVRQLLIGVSEVLDADRADVWLRDDETGELCRLAGPDRLAEAAVDRRPGPAASEAGATGHSIVRGGAGSGGAASLAVPVTFMPPKGLPKLLGVLSLCGSAAREAFTTADVAVTKAIASRLASAIESGRMVTEGNRREVALAGMGLAHELQRKLLPELTDFEDLADIAARCEPVESVGGDFYNLIRLPGSRLGIMLGDVSSHGYSSGLIMALMMSAAPLVAARTPDPGKVLREIHRLLVRKLESTEMYMTVFYGVLDSAAGTLRFANAGHPHAFRVSRDYNERLQALNPPLGIAEFDSYAQAETEWTPGEDTLLLLTDGITECARADRMWSDDQFVEAVRIRADSEASAVLEAVFELSGPLHTEIADDRTALVVK